jgi:hypothetical protein
MNESEIDLETAQLMAKIYLGEPIDEMTNKEINERIEELAKIKEAMQPKIVFRDSPTEKPKPFYKHTRKNSSNFERTGKRDQTVSIAARWIGDRPNALAEGIRHIDGDLEQVCTDCWKVYVFIEASADSTKKAFITRGKAEDTKHKSWAIRLIHHPHDINLEKPIKSIQVWDNGRDLVGEKKNYSWEEFHALMEKLQLLHKDRNGCSKRPFFKD